MICLKFSVNACHTRMDSVNAVAALILLYYFTGKENTKSNLTIYLAFSTVIQNTGLSGAGL